MPIVHIEQLDGESAADWIAYAKSELARWSEFYERDATWARILAPQEGVIIRLRQVGQFQYIAILAGGGTYTEFETTGFPVFLHEYSQSGVSALGYKAAVVGVTFDGKKAKASILSGKRQTNTANASTIKREQNVGLVDEPAHYLGGDSTKADAPKRADGSSRTNPFGSFQNVLYRSWAPGHPHNSAMLRAFNWGGAGSGLHSHFGSFETYGSRDLLYDVPYQDGSGKKPVRRAYIRTDADWPRSNGQITVKDSTYGSRTFAIYVDSFSQFFVFPLSTIEARNGILQNVPDADVKMQAAELPAWAYQPSEKLSQFYAENVSGPDFVNILDMPEMDWRFHPDGTKACTIVYEREPANFDAPYFAAPHASGTPFSQSDFDTFIRDEGGSYCRHGYQLDMPGLEQRYCVAPGIVEVSINITLTGPNPEDFTFDLPLTEVRRPITAEHCTLLAGYVWYDIPGGTGYVADRGDMIVLDIERYYNQASDPFGLYTETASFFSVKNLTQDTELSTWYGGNFSTDTGEISNPSGLIEYDLETCSFVFAANWTQTAMRTNPTRPGSVLVPVPEMYVISHTAAAIVTFNTLQTILFPDTIPDDAKDAITAAVNTAPRDSVDGWTFVALNDLRDWNSTPELTNLRHSLTSPGETNYTFTTPTADTKNWWNALGAYFVESLFLPYIDTPRFSWHCYADEIMNRLAMTPHSTFFAHPNGSWGFFDQQRIYNSYGMYIGGGSDNFDSLSGFIDDGVLEHVIYDAVHLANKKGSLDTSFIELYNLAVTSAPTGSLTDTFNTVTKDDLKAQFTKSAVDGLGGAQSLQLQMDWYPMTAGSLYFFEQGYVGGDVGGTTFGQVGAGGLIDLTMGEAFYTAPDFGGDIKVASTSNMAVTFSSVVMIT